MGEKLKNLRKTLRMSQEELAEQAGVSRQTISAIEAGMTSSVRTGTLEAIAKAVGVSVSYFFTDDVS